MIIFYEGVPGSGKSYDAIVKIVANLKKKRKVYTNIDGLDDCKCIEMIKSLTGLDDYDIELYLHVLSREQVFHFWDFIEPGSFVVIDEMQKFFNARDWQKEENRKCADWCSTHRHEGFDALFLTQRIEKVDTQVRTLTEWTYRYKKINFLGKLVNRSYVCFAYSGDDTHQPLTKIVRQYEPKYFYCYKSYITKDVKEQNIQTHANILKHPVFILIPIVLCLTVFFFIRSGINHGKIAGLSLTSSASASTVKKEMKIVPDTYKPEMPKLIKDKNELKSIDIKSSVVDPKQEFRYAKKNGNKIFKIAENKNENKKIDNSYAIINGKKIGYCEEGICEN